MFFGLGGGELILVAVLALIFIGPERLPGLAKSAGKIVRQVRDAVDDIKKDFHND